MACGMSGQDSVWCKVHECGISAGLASSPSCVLNSYITLSNLFKALAFDFNICKTRIRTSTNQYHCRDEQ